nr:MAG TPA: hypothetical protein [Caudoviricetes sp.]
MQICTSLKLCVRCNRIAIPTTLVRICASLKRLCT